MSTNKSKHEQTNRTVAKSAGVIGFATLCSRILGFIRDIVIARLFGTQLYAQAFVVAFKIPNLLRDFVGEGAANAAFVPVFSEYDAKRTKQEFWELANVLLNVMLVVLSAITLLGIIFSPLIVRLIAPGFIASPEKLEATIRLNRIIFPYILLIGLTAYAVGLLNSLKHFIIPAFAPCLLNISIIIFARLFGEGTKGLALGILVGGALQLAVQLPVLYKKGFRPKLFKSFKHPELKTIIHLMLPRMLSSSIYQLNNFVDSIFGSLAFIVGEGGVAVLYFSYRLIQFPIGIVSNALSQAILPTLSRQALDSDHEKLKHTVSWGLRSSFFIMLPASFAFMALSFPIVSTLFGGGRFDLQSAEITSQALFFYSIGLFAYGSTKILQSCFFALKDTVTPTKIAGLALAINIVLNSILMFPFKIGGIALATSISGIITFFILFSILIRKLKDFKTREIFISFLRIIGASVFMGLSCFWAEKYFISIALNKVVKLFLLFLAGSVSYAVFCFLFRVSELGDLVRWVGRKR